jgi:hypothetical protein
MRTIVVGRLTTQNGITSIPVWFRFPVVGAARQAYYAGSVTPQAPGDYANADSAELAAFQSGQWIERAGFNDVIDPTSTLAQIQTRLVNLYNIAKPANKSADDTALADWASSFDGVSTWTMKSA